MRPPTRRGVLGRGTLAAAALAAGPARAESATLRVSHGYSVGYLPLMVMRDHALIEKHAASLGLGKTAVEWQIQDGGNNINDAVLAGVLDIAGIGLPGYLVLRDRTLGRRQEMVGIGALSSGALWLNTIDPRIRSLEDYTSADRIAVPGIKTSYAAVVLQMAAAKAFGPENYARLDPLTVGLSHPDAYAAMMSGGSEIKSHLASAPFSYQELENPKVHRVFTTVDVIGAMTILVTMVQRAFAQANPGLVRAFLAAQEEANRRIAEDRDGAVGSYLRATGLRTPREQLLRILADPENVYGTAPNGGMVYAAFLARIGTLRNKPAAWTDLFVPELHDRRGS